MRVTVIGRMKYNFNRLSVIMLPLNMCIIITGIFHSCRVFMT